MGSLILPATRLGNISHDREKKDTESFPIGRRHWRFVERKTPCIFCGGSPDCHAKCMEERAKIFFEKMISRPIRSGYVPAFRREPVAKYKTRRCKNCKRKIYPKVYKRDIKKELAKYRKTDFCSLDCEISFEYPGGRFCNYCGEPLRRRSHERKNRYLARKHCNNTCATSDYLKKNSQTQNFVGDLGRKQGVR